MVVIKNGSKRKFLLREKWKIISIIKVSLVIFKSVKLPKNQKYHWNVIIWNILFTFPSTKYFNLVYFWWLNFQLLWYIAPKWLFFFFGFWILPISRVLRYSVFSVFTKLSWPIFLSKLWFNRAGYNIFEDMPGFGLLHRFQKGSNFWKSNIQQLTYKQNSVWLVLRLNQNARTVLNFRSVF